MGPWFGPRGAFKAFFALTGPSFGPIGAPGGRGGRVRVLEDEGGISGQGSERWGEEAVGFLLSIVYL